MIYVKPNVYTNEKPTATPTDDNEPNLKTDSNLFILSGGFEVEEECNDGVDDVGNPHSHQRGCYA